eukprot:CAMPEP_0202894088 /NCGR_PEP_ID=MMETSP1392-20130828/3535_1 /ASSEMBLY_ACC=CAM_ASM_000868 /TAXON_ID=225041 /ORGANISM="Chlamydomonas chlamydogama, Strain SAG 11-48b" /LENGTH=49 /DNA_ID= /DNA_START= /DNA_END= /DNA_ORIENTATION=
MAMSMNIMEVMAMESSYIMAMSHGHEVIMEVMAMKHHESHGHEVIMEVM